jgi:hypothetical protein
MVLSELRSSRRPLLARIGVLTLAVLAGSCGLDTLTSSETAKAVSVALSGDSLLTVGISRPFALRGSESATDFARTTITFDMLDTAVARLDSTRGTTAWVSGRRNGNARLSVTVRAPEIPEGRRDTVAFRVRYGAIRIDAIDTIAGLGPINGANQRVVVVRGVLPTGAPLPGTPVVTATVLSRDTLRLRPATPGSGTLVARDTGFAWVVASFDGNTDSTRVVIRRRVTRVIASGVTFNSLFRARAPQVRVLDAGDSAIANAPYSITGIDTLRLQVDLTVASAPRLVARQRDTASFVATSGTVASTRVGTSVAQVPASLIVSAGAGQSARYSSAVAVRPSVIVRDSGGQGVPNIAVTFSVPNAGNGSITGAAAVTDAAGVATVGSWVLGPTSGTDSLVATASGIPPVVLTATATPGTPARVRFVQQPLGGGVSQPLSPSPTVSVVDSAGNIVSAFADSITVALVPPVAGGTGGAFTGQRTVLAAAGLARFDSLVFADTASQLRLVAQRSGLAPDTSAIFAVGRAPTQLVVTTQPQAVAGGGTMQPFTFELRDASGARSVGAADTVVLSLSGAPSGMSLAGTVRRAAVAGRVTFNDVRVLGPGAGSNYRIEARTASGLSVTSNVFSLVLGPAAALQFLGAPANVAPGVTQQVQVIVTDSGGNRIFANSGAPVLLRLATNPAGAVITDSLRTTSSGFVSFFPSVSAAGTGYRFVASSTGLITATSAPFAVQAAGTARRVRFVSKDPIFSSAPGGVGSIELLDSAFVRTATTRLPYTISIVSGPTGAVVTSAVDSVFNAGVAFPSARLRQAGVYRLAVSAPGVTPDTSGPIQVSASSGTRLALLGQPGAVGVNSAVPTVQVALTDSLGNITTFLPGGSFVANGLVIAVSGLDGAGNATPLGGQATRTTSNSIATFDSVTVPAVGSGYRLVFSATGVQSVTSDTFSVRAAGTPRSLRVSALPSTINGGSRFSPVFRVSFVDSLGTTVSSRTDSVFLALRGPTGAVLSGAVRVAAVNGVASFPALAVARADSGLRIVATTSAAGVVADSTPLFRVNVGPVSRLRILTPPTAQVTGGIATPSLVLAATDSGGNIVTSSTDSVTYAATPSGLRFFSAASMRKRLVNGVASFDSVSAFGGSGTSVRYFGVGLSRSYSIVDTSAAVTLQIGPPAKVSVLSSPALRNFYQWNLGLSVRFRDAAGNPVDTANRPVTVTLIGGTPGATLSGSITPAPGGGTGSFRIETPGRGYRLVVSSPGLLPDTTLAFSVAGPVVRAAVISAPTTGVRNGGLSAIRVVPVDAIGIPMPFNGLQVSVSGPITGTRIRTAAFTDTMAVATFDDLRPDSAGRVVIRTSVPDVLTPIPDSAVVQVAAYSAAQSLAFVQQPSSLLAGTVMAVTPTVAIRDSVGNTVTDSAGRVITLSLGANPGSGFLSGTLSATQAPGSGVVSFANLSINNTGNGYALLATSPNVNAAASQTFNVVSTGDAIALRFITNTVPASTTAGTALASTGGALAVEVINSTGARVTSSTAPISLSVQGNRSNLSGTVTVAAVNGVATFTGTSLTRADTGLVLLASSSTLIGAQAPTRVSVAAAAPTALAVLDSMPTTEAGRAWPALRVAVVDAFGNVVRTATDTVSILSTSDSYVQSTPVEYWLAGASTRVPVVNGIATFTGLRPRRVSFASSFYNFLNFIAPNRTLARSPRFTVTASTAVAVASGLFTKSDYVRNEPITGLVYASDSLENQAEATFTASFSATLDDGSPLPAGVTAVFDATTLSVPRSATWRVIISGNTTTLRVRINVVGTGLAQSIQSPSFVTVAPFGPAARLGFTQQPSTAARGATIVPSVVVAVTDTLGNVVTNLTTGSNGLTGTIELDLPNGSTIGGATTALIGGAAVNLVSGRATFPSLAVNNAGSGYQLRARVSTGTTVTGNPTAVTSTPFTITP